ncbi:MAG: hypothetical protein LC713_02735, partial [Actinobacteria bacterium]|nr:hypothetical protein [Actinomycetota bacterium]
MQRGEQQVAREAGRDRDAAEGCLHAERGVPLHEDHGDAVDSQEHRHGTDRERNAADRHEQEAGDERAEHVHPEQPAEDRVTAQIGAARAEDARVRAAEEREEGQEAEERGQRKHHRQPPAERSRAIAAHEVGAQGTGDHERDTKTEQQVARTQQGVVPHLDPEHGVPARIEG